MGGGGSSGSGKVDYPVYLKATHATWLKHADLDGGGGFAAHHPDDTGYYNLLIAMNHAWAHNPFEAQIPYDPDADIAAALVRIQGLTNLTLLVSSNDVEAQILDAAVTFVDGHIYNTTSAISKLNTLVDAHAAEITWQYDSKIYPKFQKGMQDINAVMSSAFVVGNALIAQEEGRNISKFTSELYFKLIEMRGEMVIKAAETLLRGVAQETSLHKDAAALMLEYYRIKIVAKKEEFEQTMHIEESEGKWDLDVWTHGFNALGAVHGTAIAQPPKENKTMSAIGGALSGIGAGAQMGSAIPGVGTAAGGIIGGIAGLFGGIF